jgi:hypothetical protein
MPSAESICGTISLVAKNRQKNISPTAQYLFCMISLVGKSFAFVCEL